MTLQLANPNLLRLSPYVVATRDNRQHFDLAPFGLVLAEEHRIDPHRVGSATFLDLLKRVDEVTFGPEGMPMPRWVFFDGAELPGGIVGFGAPAADLSDASRDLLTVPDHYAGLVPFSMFIAIPTFEEGVWMAHNLASVAGVMRQANLQGLGSLTKALGLKVFRASAQVGATQWNSFALRVHVRLGALALLTAWTPAHSEAWTLTYRVEITEAGLRNLARDISGHATYPPTDDWIDSDDHLKMQRIQARIESNSPVWVSGVPVKVGPQRFRVPLSFSGPASEATATTT